jgi:PKD repeat protein
MQSKKALASFWLRRRNSRFASRVSSRRAVIESLETRTLLSALPLTGSTGNVITGFEGSSTGTVLLGPFTDGNQAATVADYTTPPGSVVVNWGDGSAPQTLATSNLTSIGSPNGVEWTVNAAHTYTEEGTYAYTVTVSDDDGAATIVSGSAVIADAPLTAGPAIHLAPSARVSLPGTTIVATFTDANSFATTGDYTDQIDWGDGSPESTGVIVATATPGVFDVEAGHSYAESGIYTTLVTVHDDGGSQVVIEGSATITVKLPAPVSVNLVSAYNLVGITADGAKFSSLGGLDGQGNAISAALIGTGQQTIGGVSYQIGSVGSKNVVQARGQQVRLSSGQFSQLDFLATGVDGNQRNTKFVVHYTDGTSHTFTQSISDWFTPQNFSGETTAVTMSYRNKSHGSKDHRTFKIYRYSLALDSSKTVQSITLPNNRHVEVLAMTEIS